jgi:hypothetical protein
VEEEYLEEMLIGTRIVDATCNQLTAPFGNLKVLLQSMSFTLLFLRQIIMIALHPRHLDINGGGIL